MIILDYQLRFLIARSSLFFRIYNKHHSIKIQELEVNRKICILEAIWYKLTLFYTLPPLHADHLLLPLPYLQVLPLLFSSLCCLIVRRRLKSK